MNIEELMRMQESEINRLRDLFVQVDKIIEEESIDRALPKQATAAIKKLVSQGKSQLK